MDQSTPGKFTLRLKPGTSPNDLKRKLSNPESKAAAKIARKRIKLEKNS